MSLHMMLTLSMTTTSILDDDDESCSYQHDFGTCEIVSPVLQNAAPTREMVTLSYSFGRYMPVLY